MNYDIFGITVRADRELPFRLAGSNDEPDVEVVEEPALASSVEAEEFGFTGGQRYTFRYGGWICLCRTDEGRLVYSRLTEGELKLPFWHVLERTGLPCWLAVARRQLLIVHGSSVRTPFGGWLFIAETGVGKSSTAFALARDHGMALASDEMAVLDVDAGALCAGSPGVRLRPELGAGEYAVASGEIHPNNEKHWYRFPEDWFAEGEVPLSGICKLVPGGETGGERLEGGERLTGLLEQTFEFEDAADEWRERRFRNAAALAKSVPIYEFRYRRSEDGTPTHVDDLYVFLHKRGGS